MLTDLRRLLGGDAAQVLQEGFGCLQLGNTLRTIDEMILEAGALFCRQFPHQIPVDEIELVYLLMVHCCLCDPKLKVFVVM